MLLSEVDGLCPFFLVFCFPFLISKLLNLLLYVNFGSGRYILWTVVALVICIGDTNYILYIYIYDSILNIMREKWLYVLFMGKLQKIDLFYIALLTLKYLWIGLYKTEEKLYWNIFLLKVLSTSSRGFELGKAVREP